MRLILLSLSFAATSLLGGCAALQSTDSLFGLITPSRIDIVQGNAVTREQAALIKPGQTRLQVRDILGTPLLPTPSTPTAGTTSSRCADPTPTCSAAAWWCASKATW